MTNDNGAHLTSRRDFFKSLATAAVGTTMWLGLPKIPALASIPKGIKITGLKTFVINNMVFVKIYTNEGVTGLGEGSKTGRALTIKAAIEEHERLLIGRDPTNIELLWQQMFRWPRTRSGPIINTALSAIDIALWDILGKILDVPIYKLLGGAAREKIRLYAMVQRVTVEALTEQVHQAKAEGFTAVRSGLAFLRGNLVRRPWDLKWAITLIEAMRNAAGDDVDIIDDAHGMLTPTMAMEYARALEPYRLMFLEDPALPDDIDTMRWLKQHIATPPLAIGESLHGKHAFRDYISERLVSYVRPDVVWVGGITETKKIGAMAEANFVKLALHVGPSPVANLAAAHVAACTPNCTIVECSGRPHHRPQQMRDLFMGGDIHFEEGYAELPDKPGLGCDLDEELAEKFPYRPTDLPRLQFEDGSVSDW